MEKVEEFKSYDIRGRNFTPNFIDRISDAVIAYLQEKKLPGIVIGNDKRETSEILKNSLAGRSLISGIDVILIQDSENSSCSTPLFNYVCSLNPDYGGIMVTASHNPSKYNGLKINGPECRAIGYHQGLNKCEQLYIEKQKPILKKQKGKLETIYPIEEMVKETCGTINLKENGLKGIEIAVDVANAMGVIDSKYFFDYLGADVKYINDWIDFSFPAHQANPIDPKNLKMLSSLVRSNNFFCGFTTDGDGDRLGIVDENGVPLYSHNIASIALEGILGGKRGGNFHAIYTTTMGRSFRDAIKRNGGKPHMVNVGRVHVINKGIKLTSRGLIVIMGAEGSNHIMFIDKRGNFYENTHLAMLSSLSYCLRNNKKMSKTIEETDSYLFLGEKNYRINGNNKKQLKEYLQKNYPKILNGKLEEKDGILVENENSWFSIRESNTEPLIRLNVESPSKDETKKIAQNLEEIIFEFGGEKE